MRSWKLEKPEDRKHTVRKGAKFEKVSTIPVIRSLVGLGFKEEEIGIILGVAESTIKSWKQRYPQIFEANEEGKQILKALICAEMIRCATGYDYDEVDETYSSVPITGDDGKPTVKKVLTKTVVHKKHQPSNTDLIKFISNNLMPDIFPRTPTEVHNNILQIIGQVEPDRIKQLAGRLVDLIPNTIKPVESTEVKPNESGHTG